jgi:hypothetical protein
MKKLLALVAVLAMVAALVIPMAAFAEAGPGTYPVTLSGNVPFVASVLLWNTPSNITQWGTSWTGNENGGQLKVGDNYAQSTPGYINFTQGNDGMTGWKLVITMGTGYESGQMYSYDAVPAGFLPSPLQINMDNSGTVQNVANFQNYAMTGTASVALDLQAKQTVGTTDKAGTYGFTLTYTLTPVY